jgi:hypothetical protein
MLFVTKTCLSKLTINYLIIQKNSTHLIRVGMCSYKSITERKKHMLSANHWDYWGDTAVCLRRTTNLSSFYVFWWVVKIYQHFQRNRQNLWVLLIRILCKINYVVFETNMVSTIFIDVVVFKLLTLPQVWSWLTKSSLLDIMGKFKVHPFQ